MNKKEILKTIHDLLSVRKGNKGYNDVWNKGYELHQLIETKQLTLTVVSSSLPNESELTAEEETRKEKFEHDLRWEENRGNDF
jgi:hypothetical protein